MAEGVVLHPMPAAVHLRHEIGMGGDLAAEAKKGRARAAAVETIEHRRRHFGMRPVVNGQPDGFLLRAKAGDDR